MIENGLELAIPKDALAQGLKEIKGGEGASNHGLN